MIFCLFCKNTIFMLVIKDRREKKSSDKEYRYLYIASVAKRPPFVHLRIYPKTVLNIIPPSSGPGL